MVDNQQACVGLRSYSEAVTNVTSPLSLPFKHVAVKIEVIIHPKQEYFISTMFSFQRALSYYLLY